MPARRDSRTGRFAGRSIATCIEIVVRSPSRAGPQVDRERRAVAGEAPARAAAELRDDDRLRPATVTPFDQSRSQIVERGSASRFVNETDSVPRQSCPSVPLAAIRRTKGSRGFG